MKPLHVYQEMKRQKLQSSIVTTENDKATFGGVGNIQTPKCDESPITPSLSLMDQPSSTLF